MRFSDRKIVIIAAVALFVIIVGYYIIKKYRERAQQKQAAQGGNEQYSTPVSQLCTRGDAFPLSIGSCGSNVKALQTALGGLTVDGKFGPKTEGRLQIATGKTTITEAELQKLLQSDPVSAPAAGGVATATSTIITNLTQLVTEIRTDDKAVRISPRSGTEQWVQSVLALNDEQLGKLAELYKTTYNESLYSVVDDMFFSTSTQSDTRIMARLEALGKTA